MSTDGDASSRLSDELEQILSGVRSRSADDVDTGQVPAADWSVDDEPGDVPPAGADGEPYELPEIVPATIDVPAEADGQRADQSVATPTVTSAPVVGPPVSTGPALPSTGPAQPVVPAAAGPAAGGWTDYMAAGTVTTGPQLRAPGRRPRVRRVTRVLRHIDPWSTFKVALFFSMVSYVVALTAGVLLWRVADSTGTLDNVERWFTQFGWETFELKGGEIFHNAWIIGLFGVVAMTGGLVLLATLFNLVSDIVGGVRLTVLEEEVVERTQSSNRRYVVRRTPTGLGDDGSSARWQVDDEPPQRAPRPSTTAPADWSVDDE